MFYYFKFYLQLTLFVIAFLLLCTYIPIFQNDFFVTVQSAKPFFSICAHVLISLFFDTIFTKIGLLSSGGIETNLGP